MHNDIGRALNAFNIDTTTGGMEQGQQFGGSIATVFMRLTNGMTIECPTVAGIGFGLIRSGFIFTPHTQPARFSDDIGFLYQLFFASLSGSVTTSEPAFRFRTTWPV